MGLIGPALVCTKTHRMKRASLGALAGLLCLGAYFLSSHRMEHRTQASVVPSTNPTTAAHHERGDGRDRQDQARTVGQSSEQLARAKTREAIRSFAASIVEAASNISAADSYEACFSSGTCKDVGSDILYEAIAISEAEERAHGYECAKGQAIVWDTKTASNEMAQIASESLDVFERVTALLCLTYDDRLKGKSVRLPESTYLDLAGKPIPEIMLIAEHHRSTPVYSSSIANEFVRLADSTDIRAQRAAITALGHKETASHFAEIVNRISFEGANAGRAALSAVTCGLSCSDSVVRLLSVSRKTRMALYEMLAFARTDEKEALQNLIVDHVPAGVDDEESKARAEMLSEMSAAN